MKHILCSGNNAWGMYNFRKAVLKHLLQKGFRVTVAAPYDEVYFPLLQALGCEVFPLELDAKGTNPWSDFRLYQQYVHLFRTLRPALSITYTIKPNIYGSLAAQWTNTLHLPITTGLGYAFTHRSLVGRVTQWLYRLAFRKAKKVLFLNDADAEEFIKAKLIDECQSQIIPGEGVDLSKFATVSYPEPTAPVRFLLIARLLGDKGVREFVSAAHRIKAKYPEVEFQLLGEIWKENPTAITQEEVDLWVEDGFINYLGKTSDVRPLIAQASCVVLPSYREGMPRTLLEGAAMARPLIATNVPGCRDLIVEGENGFLCAPKDGKSLAEACEKFLALSYEERKTMGQKGLALVKDKFAMDTVLTHYDRIFEDLQLL